MTMPTASQIEAAVAQPSYRVRLYLGGAWVDVSADVVDVDGTYEVSMGDGLGFGLAPAPTQRVAFARERLGTAWRDTPIEISLGFNGTNPIHFLGRITGVREGRTGGEWTCSGYQDLIAAAPEIRSPLLYRRPAFTATTASSNENPDNAGWAGGLGNLILWRAGGRPYEQSATYPTALFYYSCETSIMAPEWTWLNGGDAAQALDELCRAAGGVVYQGMDGVIRYQEPMTFGAGVAAIHYTDAMDGTNAAIRAAAGLAQYGDLERSADVQGQVVDVVRCAYVARRLQGVQRVYQDTTPRLVEAGAVSTITLDLSLPCYRVSRVEAVGYTLRSTRLTTASEVTVAIGTTYAQQVTVTITNTLSEPIGLSELALYAMPLVAMEEGTATYGSASGTPRSYAVPDSVYIQTASHARRLCHMYHDWYNTPRPPVTLSGCGYDPRRSLGEIITLTSAYPAISAERHRVSGIQVGRTGVEMTLTVVPVTGLPVETDFFVLGTTYSDANSRQLTY